MKNITIVRDISKANAITHGGIFHADEIFATVLLSKIMEEVRVCRTFDVPTNLAKDVIIYDIGGGKYDHHQRDFNLCRKNGVKYSSFGLLWKKFGMDLLKGLENPELIFEFFDKYFVSGIDAVDNGQVEKSRSLTPLISISGIISGFNPNWDEKATTDEKFLLAIQTAEILFDNSLNSAISKAKAKSEVEKAIENSSNGIMILDTFMPWQDYIFSSLNEKAKSILYVIFPSIRNGYNVQAVPYAPGSFGNRKPFPENWAGLMDFELSKVSGVKTAIFCHKSRFLCSAKTFEDALLLAKKAVAN